MALRYETYADLPAEPLLSDLLRLLTAIFPDSSVPDFRDKLTDQRDRTGLYVQLAVDGERVAGCKLGYEEEPGRFYSWLGAVDPAYRSRGIASELMQQQHDWCRRQSYHTVQTQTYNQWRSMLILNLRMGFDITGTRAGRYGLVILLEKTL